MFRSLHFKWLVAAALLISLLLIGGAVAEEPIFTVTFDKTSYKAGETVKAHYKFDFKGEYTELGAEWRVVTDWEDGSAQSGGWVDLTKLEGDLSFTPKYGEGVALNLSLTDSNGQWHYFWGDPVRVEGFLPTKPKFIVTFDKDSYQAGETVNVHYKIEHTGKYSDLGAEWRVVTDWEDGSAQSGGWVDLTSLEGDLSFTPKYGEGVALNLSLTDANDEWHYNWGDPIRVTGFINVEPEFTVIFDKDSYALGETVKAHYKFDFDGEYTELGAEWRVVTDWEDGSAQSGGWVDLTKLEGDLSFRPKFGEGVALNLSLTDSNGQWHYNWGEPVRMYTAQDILLPKSLKLVKTEAFEGANFMRLVCPDGMLAIEARAFANCTNLLSIEIPASVETIAEDAFEGCSSLTTFIVAEDSVAEAYARRHSYEISYL